MSEERDKKPVLIEGYLKFGESGAEHVWCEELIERYMLHLYRKSLGSMADLLQVKPIA